MLLMPPPTVCADKICTGFGIIQDFYQTHKIVTKPRTVPSVVRVAPCDADAPQNRKSACRTAHLPPSRLYKQNPPPALPLLPRPLCAATPGPQGNISSSSSSFKFYIGSPKCIRLTPRLSFPIMSINTPRLSQAEERARNIQVPLHAFYVLCRVSQRLAFADHDGLAAAQFQSCFCAQHACAGRVVAIIDFLRNIDPG